MSGLRAAIRVVRSFKIPCQSRLLFVLIVCIPVIVFLLFGTNKRVYIVIKEREQSILQELLVTQNHAPRLELNKTDVKGPDDISIQRNNTITQHEDEREQIKHVVTSTESMVFEKVTKKPTRIKCSTILDDLVCEPNQPCMYEDEVDLRIIVIVYDRSKSLRKALEHLQKLKLDESTTKMEIWLDCGKDGFADVATYDVAKNYTWAKGSSRVHVWKSHVGIYGQFTDTWGPREGTNETAIIVEDDVDVAPMAWRWLKAAKKKYDKVPKISGYALSERKKTSLTGTPVYLSRHSETWGFAPKADVFSDFQRWFHIMRQDKDFHPRLKEDKQRNAWYDKYEKEESMWSMWYQYFLQMREMYAMNCRMKNITGKVPKVLAYNRQEQGLHYKGPSKKLLKGEHLLDVWDKKYVHLPDSIPVVNYNMSYYLTLNTINNTEYLDDKYMSKEQ